MNVKNNNDSLSVIFSRDPRKEEKKRKGRRKKSAVRAVGLYMGYAMRTQKTRRSILLYRVGIDHAVEGRKSAV